MIRSPLFIVGYPRSGTTLLSALLEAHREVWLANEPELIGDMRRSGLTISKPVTRKDRMRLLEQVRTSNGACWRHLSTLPPELLTQFLAEPGEMSFGAAYEFLLPKNERIKVWGEKSLGNMFFIGDLHALYPNALIIHIIRDPRAALLSYYRKHAGKPELTPRVTNVRYFAKKALQWSLWVTVAREAGLTLAENSFIQLRYEDLVTKPEAELRRICNALGLEVDAKVLNATYRAQIPELRGWSNTHENILKPIDASRAQSGSQLPAWACYIVEKFSGETMEKVGYALSRPEIGLHQRLSIEGRLLLGRREVRGSVRNERQKRIIAHGTAKDMSERFAELLNSELRQSHLQC